MIREKWRKNHGDTARRNNCLPPRICHTYRLCLWWTLENRLRGLGEYSEYWMRRELRILEPLLKPEEELLCVLAGINTANRKMLAVTDDRLIIIFAGALGSGEIKEIKKEAVTDYRFEKELFSKLTLTAAGEDYVFTNTQGNREELFEWAMKKQAGSK